jgi:hypothetical protein
MLWGGNPEKDGLYLPITPARNDGRTIHKLTVGNVPVNGFWSLTVYNSAGYLQPNPENAYSVNSHGGLELHGSPISPPTRDPRRNMEIPGGHARELSRRNVQVRNNESFNGSLATSASME